MASRSAKILIAEDNPVNMQIALTVLRKAQFSPDGVSDGAQALAALEQTHYDLILMDCQMPVLDGFETTRRIRAHHDPRIRTIPIIAMTANALREDEAACLAAGMDGYLAKPVKAVKLIETVEKKLSEHGARQSSATTPSQSAPAAHSEKDSAALIDLAMVHSLKKLKLDPKIDFFMQLFVIFDENLKTKLAQLDVCLKDKDFALMTSIGHEMKSSSANLGARKLSEVFAQIEMKGKEQELDSLATLIRSLPPLVTLTLEQLKDAHGSAA